MFKKILVACCLLLSLPLHAVWYEGEGQAMIMNGEVEVARRKAIQEALLNVMYRGGASVRSLQEVRSGILETDSLTVRTNGEIHDFRLLHEKIEDNIITVTISADIFPVNMCSIDDYKKTLFVGPFDIKKLEHAQLGGIYRLGEEVAHRLHRQLSSHSQRFDTRHLMTRAIALGGRHTRDLESQVLDIARTISQDYDVQFVTVGRILDLSHHNEVSTNFLGLSSSERLRNFHIRLMVVDGIRGEIVLRRDYSFQQEWPYDVTLKLDVSGETFWRTHYGQGIEMVIGNMVRDLESELHCKQSLATVVSVFDNQAVINLGYSNGVRKGDKFRLVRRQHLMYQTGQVGGPVFNDDEIVLEVVAVQADRAVLTTHDFADMANLQIRDVLVAVNDIYPHSGMYVEQ
ncbi:flagellar assembly protein T N-terminal domain-containing protein [Aliagarivorans taiwanensis]|uniref:flagellar assembly protein T N-terminal domain-containing protein n=1 Tax=Aliagarivorans taiwanensis TaxID=561966 RepID=UPI001FE05F26|nr:flagellar assembly protein T N-terminal domain-containing protein [Aliagarivorans taiwanensis]